MVKGLCAILVTAVGLWAVTQAVGATAPAATPPPAAQPAVAPPMEAPPPAPAKPLIAPLPKTSEEETALILIDPPDGQAFQVVLGRHITVRLRGNPTTGYRWRIDAKTGDAVKGEVEPDFFRSATPQKPMVGVGGTFLFALDAVKAGESKVTFAYRRAWEKDKPAEKSITLTFTVKADPTADRMKALRADLGGFVMTVRYIGGAEDKPFYNLTLHVGPVTEPSEPFSPVVQITQEEAARLIDYLASGGYLARAQDVAATAAGVPPAEAQGYTVTVKAKDVAVTDGLGWNLRMMARLDGLRSAMTGPAADNMDRLIGRLSGYQKLWAEAARRAAEYPESAAPAPMPKN